MLSAAAVAVRIAVALFSAVATGGDVNGFVVAPGAPLRLPAPALHLAAGDFDGDGHVDLLAASAAGRSLYLLRGLGGGRFALGPAMDVGMAPHLVAVADFDGDGRPDAALAGHDTNEIVVLTARAGGLAIASRPPALGAPPAHNHGLVAADFDGDGRTDLASVNHADGSVSLLAGDGRAGFRPAAGSPFRLVAGPYSPAVADFDRDGRPDLAVPSVPGGHLQVMLGRGGSFVAGARLPSLARPFFAAACDFDGDGRSDVLATHDGSMSVSLWRGDGRGAFTALAPLRSPTPPVQAVCADFDGDGRVDLAVSSGTVLAVWRGEGGGRFAAMTGSPLATAGGSWSLLAVDLDGDGRPDLASADSQGRSVSIYLRR